MMKCKHQWDYIMHGRERLPHNTWAHNDLIALWICPKCSQRKKLIIEKGESQ